MAGKSGTKKVNRLEDLLVEEVSIVDRPANKRKFLIVKNAEGAGELVTDEEGNLVSGEVQKNLTVPLELKREMFKAVGGAMERLRTVMNLVDFARVDGNDVEGKDSTLMPVLQSELQSLSKVVSDAAKMFGKVTKEDEGDEDGRDEVLKAVWTTAQINDFPDSSFLYIVPGGTKDSSGKTVPRTNRMFPVRDASGTVDLPHLRNAIARIPQSSLSTDLKTKLQAEARRMLDAASKDDSKKGQKVDAKKVADELSALVEKLEGELVEKRGAKMSKTRLARFKDALTALHKIVEELEAASKGAPPGAPPAPPVKKDETVEKAIGDLTSNVSRLTDVVKSQAQRIKELTEVRGRSNVMPVEKTSESRKKSDRVSWPLDMNDEKTRDKVDKRISFYES